MAIKRFAQLFGVLILVTGCSPSPASKFPEAYNEYMRQRSWGNEFPVHDVSCIDWKTGKDARNDMYTCYFKYMYLPWNSNTKVEKEGSHVLLHTKGTDDWWISRNQ